MDKVYEMKELIQTLISASEAYYNSGNTIMSDKEYDELFDKLKNMEQETGVVMSNSPTQNVGAKALTELNEVTHKYPMLSLDKCHSTEEIIKFAKGRDVLAMIKLDGLTIRIKYENGNLISAETRGDGEAGSDVTEHVKQFLNVPLNIKHSGAYMIDGEAIITDNDFKVVNANNEFANSRNLASGTLSVLDTSLVSKRKLRFIAWDIIEGENSNSFVERLQGAESLGFDIVPYCFVADYYTPSELDDEKVMFFINKIKGFAGNLSLPMDGVVWKFNDVAYGKSLGATKHHFRNGIAYKFKDEAVESTLKDIEWTMGKTGVLTPTAVFEPVEIEGTMVERASLHNLSIMYGLWGRTWHSGLTVSVVKANQIIPQIIAVDYPKESSCAKRLDYPKICPFCKSETSVEINNSTKVLVCKNPSCNGKLLGMLKHFVSKNAMNIDGLSESTLEKFIDENLVSDFIDIYTLKGSYNDIVKMDGFGERSAEKLIQAIENSRNTTLERFINALSIPMIGKTASRTISKFFNGDFIDFYNNGLSNPDFDWTQLEDFGQAMDESIRTYASKDTLEMVWELSTCLDFQIVNKSGNNNLDGKTFVITGKLNSFSNRDAAKDAIESHGGKVAGSVSKNTDYLVNNDILSTSGKNKKAKQLNVPIITEEELILMLK